MRRRLEFAAAIVLSMTASTASAIAQDSIDDIKIEPTDLGSGIYMLMGTGGNIGLSIGGDGVFLIDDQFPVLSEKILAAIEELGGGAPDYIINTHWHGDHTGGNETFHDLGAMIVAHDNVRLRLGTNQYTKAIDAHVDPRPKEALPVITFSEEMTFHLNSLNAQAIHAPHAHTDGDAIIVFEAQKIVHMGDLFFNGNYPFIDTSSGGTINGMISGVERVLGFVDEDWKIIPGHGPLAARGDLETYHAMLVTVRDRIRARIDDGQSLEEIIAEDPLADLNATWGQAFITAERIINPVYETLVE